MEDRKKSDVISLSVPTYMSEWLKNNPNVNRSLVFQNAVAKIMTPQHQNVPLQTTLMCIMSIISGICITLIFSVPAIQLIIGLYFSIAMMLLGIALSLSALLVFRKVYREVRSMNAQSLW